MAIMRTMDIHKFVYDVFSVNGRFYEKYEENSHPILSCYINFFIGPTVNKILEGQSYVTAAFLGSFVNDFLVQLMWQI